VQKQIDRDDQEVGRNWPRREKIGDDDAAKIWEGENKPRELRADDRDEGAFERSREVWFLNLGTQAPAELINPAEKRKLDPELRTQGGGDVSYKSVVECAQRILSKKGPERR